MAVNKIIRIRICLVYVLLALASRRLEVSVIASAVFVGTLLEMSKNPEKGKYLTPDGSRTWEYLAAFGCSLESFCIGVMLGWLSPSLIKLSEPDSPIKMTIDDASTMVAGSSVGHAIAPFISNPLIDKLGRKNALFIGGIPLIMSWALILIAKHSWMLIVARLLAGLTLGSAICAAPIYLGEISSVHLRGTINSAMSVMMNIGLLFAYIVVPYLSVVMAALIFLSITITVQIALWLAPESPYYLTMIGRPDDAELTLIKLRGKHDVTEEFEQIKDSVFEDSANKISIVRAMKSLLTVRKNSRALIIVFMLVVTHHFGGLVVLIFFAHRIFKDANTVISNNSASMLIGVTKLSSALLSTFLVDRTGRKPLILTGGILAALSNFAIGAYFYVKEYNNLDVSNYSFIPLVAAMTLVFAFNIGLVSIQGVLTSEIFSTDVKATAACLVSVSGGVLGAISGKMYLIVVESWGFGHSVPFLIFSIIVILCVILILHLTPETKGKTFMEIQNIFSK